MIPIKIEGFAEIYVSDTENFHDKKGLECLDGYGLIQSKIYDIRNLNEDAVILQLVDKFNIEKPKIKAKYFKFYAKKGDSWFYINEYIIQN